MKNYTVRNIKSNRRWRTKVDCNTPRGM